MLSQGLLLNPVFLIQNLSIAMLTSNEKLSEAIPAAEVSIATNAKKQFIGFFQSKGFTCAADSLQQLKATSDKMIVRFSVSDPKNASDQGHAVCYLSFAPINRRYKIAIGNMQQTSTNGNAYTYTLLEDTFVRTVNAKQKSTTFYSLEELLNTLFPKATSFASAITLQSFYSFLF